MGQVDITLALPKGKLGQESIKLLEQAGLPVAGLETEARRLLYEYPSRGIKYIICRPTDVPTYVEYGAADLGIAGKDVLVESGAGVLELLDLRFGYCRFVVAVPGSRLHEGQPFDLNAMSHRRVATKFPRVTEEFFRNLGVQVEVIKLHGNIELAPQVGLADMIVDIVSTGRTLAENDLVPVAEIFPATARLVANRVSFRLKYERVQEVLLAMEAAVGPQGRP
ncbi:MAG: ATP phosphoribosyltransferase [Clostridia bacterium]|nr:MAG: ATP phosphoribosyltransferase [Clostridia bacterium]